MRESRWLREIRGLDPERDCRRIVFLDTFYEFPFDTTRALELAFFKTFASPNIAELLDSTGEFTLRGQKRYDDTDLLISAFSEDGWLPKRLGARGISALLEEHVIEVLGLVRPTRTERRTAELALELRARVVQRLPPRREPRLRTTTPRRSYPDGYTLEELGPPEARAS